MALQKGEIVTCEPLKRTKRQASVQFVRSEFIFFMEQLLKMGSKQGKSISLNDVKFPKVMDGQSM